MTFKILVADALFVILVKDMYARGIDSNLDLVAALCSGSRGNAGNDVLAVGCILHSLKAEVEINLRTHKLGNVNVNLHNRVGHRGKIHRLVVNSLGTDTEDNLLTDIFLEIGVVCLLRRENDFGSAEPAGRAGKDQ